MSEIDLRQPIVFTYSAYGPFTRNRKKIKKRQIQDILIKMN